MLRFSLWESGKFLGGLAGAVLLAAAIGAQGGAGLEAFLLGLLHRLGDFFTGDFGTSAMSGAPALLELQNALPQTLFLLGAGLLLALGAGVPLGLLGLTPLRAAAPLFHLLTSLPVFCAGLVLAYCAFALLHAPPAIAPWLAVILVGAAGAVTAQGALRRAAAFLKDAPFRAGLRRLGLGRWEIERVYAAPPLFAGLFAHLGDLSLALVSAACIGEWLFDIPGAGMLLVKSVALHDWNVAALILLAFAAITLLADLMGRLIAQALRGGMP